MDWIRGLWLSTRFQIERTVPCLSVFLFPLFLSFRGSPLGFFCIGGAFDGGLSCYSILSVMIFLRGLRWQVEAGSPWLSSANLLRPVRLIPRGRLHLISALSKIA